MQALLCFAFLVGTFIPALSNDEFDLSFSQVNVDRNEVAKLMKGSLADAIAYLSKEKGLRIVVLARTLKGARKSNPEILAEAKRQEREDKEAYRYYFDGPFEGQAQGAIEGTYIGKGSDGIFRFVKKEQGELDRGVRPFRNQPTIVLTAACDTGVLTHEYLHFLIDSDREEKAKRGGLPNNVKDLLDQKKEELQKQLKLVELLRLKEGAVPKSQEFTAAENKMSILSSELLMIAAFQLTQTNNEELDIARFFVLNGDLFGLSFEDVLFNLHQYRKYMKLYSTEIMGRASLGAQLIPLEEADFKALPKEVLESVRKAVTYLEHLKRELPRREEWFEDYLAERPDLSRQLPPVP
jgi:hypothetical protein